MLPAVGSGRGASRQSVGLVGSTQTGALTFLERSTLYVLDEIKVAPNVVLAGNCLSTPNAPWIIIGDLRSAAIWRIVLDCGRAVRICAAVGTLVTPSSVNTGCCSRAIAAARRPGSGSLALTTKLS